MKFFSSIRVTSTAVVAPFFGKVAVVVAPMARSAVVRLRPADVSACALAGGATTVGDGVGVGVGVGAEVGVGEGVGVGELEGDGLADGVGLAFATGLAGAFFTGAFLTGFLTTFLATGFFAASAFSPMKNAESTPASKVMNLRRPCEFDGLSIINR